MLKPQEGYRDGHTEACRIKGPSCLEHVQEGAGRHGTLLAGSVQPQYSEQREGGRMR